MKVFISADIEGITGSSHWDETDKKSSDYAEFRDQMTAEVNAACEGALQAGATEIWVKDAHASARNIVASKLVQEARLVRGWSGHPYQMVQELDETFGALVLIGYHSRAGSDENPLAHTIARSILHMRINEQYVSELLLAAHAAALVEVPVAFVSGDAGLGVEAKSQIPGITTVAVKEGSGSSVVSIHPHLALERIKAGVQAALEQDLSTCHVDMPEHFSVEIAFKSHAKAYQSSFYPGASLKDTHTVQYESASCYDVLTFVSFVV